MKPLTRVAAIVLIAATPIAAITATAGAQTTGTYSPYTPSAQTPQQALSAAVLSKRLKTLKLSKLSKTTGVKVAFVVPGIYRLRIITKVGGKTILLARASLVVTAAAGTPGRTFLLKPTRAYKKFVAGLGSSTKRVPVSAVLTYTSPSGQSATTTTPYSLKP